uniref:photosystem II protein V n=1 Tax=Helleborus torquatus TaxID=171901 RepID=UPI0025A9CA7B|nr:photosystem II protein V [Helleborus torquatus]WIW41700.1 photosystem II protein V [Helleborus torquatus]
MEARENVHLLIILPVFDTGSFITFLYIPYSLRVGFCEHGVNVRCVWKSSAKRVFYKEPIRNSINNWLF